MKLLSVKCEEYDGNLKLIDQLKILIANQYEDLFHSVLVHGSIATKEEIKYSDFDGLLIINDNFIHSKKMATFKKESLKLILQFDPLQHHGWFQIKRSELLCYPDEYLPSTILKHAKLIFPNAPSITFEIKLKDSKNYKKALIDLLLRFEKNINENWQPQNLFQLKSFLSRIMLLPSLYYAAINNEAIFKRESFEAVKDSFSAEEWHPIIVASKIRNEWNYNLHPLQKIIMTRPERFFRKLTQKFIAPKISVDQIALLNPIFYSKLSLLLTKIKSDIK